MWIYGQSKMKYLNPDHVDTAPQVITVDNPGRENILLIEAKVAAGYADNLGDHLYYQNLPAFTFPLPEYRNATFRGFQVVGDSMSPIIQPGEWVLARAVDSLQDIRNGQIYVVVESRSIRIKEVHLSDDMKELRLVSYNTDYPPVSIESTDILEVWEYHSKVSIGLPLQESSEVLRDIYTEIARMKDLLEKLQ